MELQKAISKQIRDPEFGVGEVFKYTQQAVKNNNIYITDKFEVEHCFTVPDQLILKIVDFFSDKKDNEYKLTFIYKGKPILSKWYTEYDLIDSIAGNFITEAR